MKAGAQMELYVTIPREVSGDEPVEVRCLARVMHVAKGANGGQSLVGMRIERYECLNLRERWVS